MRTARLMTVSQHPLLGGVPAGGTCLGVYLPRGGCTCLQGVYLPTGDVPARGCTCWGVCTCPGDGPGPGGCTWSWGVYLVLGGVPAPGGYLVWGVPGRGGLTCPGTPPLWTEFLTHASENITLPQTSFAGGNQSICVALGNSKNLSSVNLSCEGVFVSHLPSVISFITNVSFI